MSNVKTKTNQSRWEIAACQILYELSDTINAAALKHTSCAAWAIYKTWYFDELSRDLSFPLVASFWDCVVIIMESGGDEGYERSREEGRLVKSELKR